jgi:hypothetical protein
MASRVRSLKRLLLHRRIINLRSFILVYLLGPCVEAVKAEALPVHVQEVGYVFQSQALHGKNFITGRGNVSFSEAEFFDEIQKKVLRVFLLAIYSHLYT